MDIKVEQNVALKKFTTYNVGGPARFFSRAQTWQEMLGLREFAKKQGVPYFILGGGTNLLIADGGYPGLVILNQMNKARFSTHSVTAESGALLSKVVVLAARHNLGGVSGLASVPGTIGGAVYGNAGIPDVSIKDVFMHAEILPADGNGPIIVGTDYCQFGYRTSKFKMTNDIILSATLKLKPMPVALIQSEINEYVKGRILKQPTGLTCGSFFKNPSQFPSAGWLIDQAGCKGMKVGGAEVSEKHANFIMNTGNATAYDIIQLALKIYKKVDEKFNVLLESEAQILPSNPFIKK